ncbi:hypothetical protein ACR6HW_04015 [Fusibacter sp. JL298sf-3]
MMRILRKPRYFNWVYQGLLIFTIVQQIYFPQSYQYMHLAVLAVRMLVSEMYQNDYRAGKWDRYFIPLVFLCAILSIIEHTWQIHLGGFYLVALMGATAALMGIVAAALKDTKAHLKTKMHPKHVEVTEKRRGFVVAILYGLYAVSALALVYAFTLWVSEI